MLVLGRPADHAGDVARILSERARRLAMPTTVRPPGGAGHLIAGLGSHRVAVPMSALVHVVPAPRVTRLPGSSTALVGLVAVGGGLVPVADLATLLQFEVEGRAPEPVLMTIEDGHSRLGLRVDRVEGQTTIRTQDIEASHCPSHPAAILTAPVAGGDLLVLNVDATLSDPRLDLTDRADLVEGRAR